MKVLKAAKMRMEAGDASLRDTVAVLIDRVRKEGDEALKEFGRRFDGCERETFRVSPAEIQEAYDALTPEEIADLRAAAEKIASATGRTPELLRPPGGLYDLDVIRRSVCADSPIILWSVDPEDWRGKSAAGIAAYVTKRAKSGDIILLHDMHASSVDAALRIVDTLEAQGFAFVTVSELALLSGTRLRGGETYYRFDFPKYE